MKKQSSVPSPKRLQRMSVEAWEISEVLVDEWDDHTGCARRISKIKWMEMCEVIAKHVSAQRIKSWNEATEEIASDLSGLILEPTRFPKSFSDGALQHDLRDLVRYHLKTFKKKR